MSKLDEYLDGQLACKNGDPADPKRSSDYQHGYSHRYWLEQQQTNQTIKQEQKK